MRNVGRAINFGKGFLAGAMVGAGVLMMMDPSKSKQCRKIKKKANGFVRQMGNMIDDMFDMH